MRRLAAVLTVALTAGACTGGDSTSPPTTGPTTLPASTGSTSTLVISAPPATTAPAEKPGPTPDPDFVLRVAAEGRVDMRSNPFSPRDSGTFPAVFGAQLYRVLPINGLPAPELALQAEPPPGEQIGGEWSIQVKLRDDLYWSDGEPIDAFDIEYTFDDLLRIGDPADLGWVPADPAGSADLLDVKALDRRTVEYRFANRPDLRRWHYGIATATILPEHYWVFTFADRAPGREADPDLGLDAPSAGAYRFDETAGGIWAWTAVEGWWNAGAEYTVYASGAVAYHNPTLGIDATYGPAEGGKVLARWVEGPYAGRIEWRPVESAARAVADGRADLHAEVGPPRSSTMLTVAAFGSRSALASSREGRAALACFLFASEISGAMSVAAVPAGGWGIGIWQDPSPADPCPGSRSDRVEEGVRRLAALGWTWDTPPRWERPMTITPAVALTVGESGPPAITVLAPAPADDPLAADAAGWIASWLSATGAGVTLREGDPSAADPASFDVGVLTTRTASPVTPFLVIDPGLGHGHLRAGTIAAALVAWEFASDRIREEALAVPLFRSTTGGRASDAIVLPYVPVAGPIHPASIVASVRPS